MKKKIKLCLSCVHGVQNQIFTANKKLELTDDCFCLNTEVFANHCRKVARIYPLLMVDDVKKCQGYQSK